MNDDCVCFSNIINKILIFNIPAEWFSVELIFVDHIVVYDSKFLIDLGRDHTCDSRKKGHFLILITNYWAIHTVTFQMLLKNNIVMLLGSWLSFDPAEISVRPRLMSLAWLVKSELNLLFFKALQKELIAASSTSVEAYASVKKNSQSKFLFQLFQ